MPKITDPDMLSLIVNGTATTEEVEINTGTKTIKLNILGNLDDTAPGKTSGVTAKAVYSFLKEEFLNGIDTTILRRFKFPLNMIFEGSFIFVNGWAPADLQTRDLFRDAGFQEQLTSVNRSCMISLGAVDNVTDLAYYSQAIGFTTTTQLYDKGGELNENINITTFNAYKKSFLRVQGKTYAEYNLLIEQGVQLLSFQAYSFPLVNVTDTNILNGDAFIDANAPYTGMSVTYLKGQGFTTAAVQSYVLNDVIQDGAGRWAFCSVAGTLDAAGAADYTTNLGTGTFVAYDGEELIGATYYAFNRVITGNGGTHGQIYEWAQRQLRLTSDINADNSATVIQNGFGIVNGEVAALLAEFVGQDLKPFGGVLLRGFDANSTNSIIHRPISVDTGGLDADFVPLVTIEVSFPFVAAGTFAFSLNLVNELDVETFYNAYFSYITRTSGSYTLTLSAGAIGDLTWTGTDLDHIQVGDYIRLSGFVTTLAMNDLYLVNTVGVNTMNITSQNGVTLITETATIQVDENPFESPNSVIVNDNSGTPLTNQIIAAAIAWDFDYTNNNQGGRIPNTNAPIHVVAQALDGAEWVEATHTITAAVGQNVAINAGDERNYENPP